MRGIWKKASTLAFFFLLVKPVLPAVVETIYEREENQFLVSCNRFFIYG